MKTIRPPIPVPCALDTEPQTVHFCSHAYLRYSGGAQMQLLNGGIAGNVSHCHIKSVSLPQKVPSPFGRAVVLYHLNYVSESSHSCCPLLSHSHQKQNLRKSNIYIT